MASFIITNIYVILSALKELHMMGMGNLQNIELVPQPQTFLVLVEIIALCTHTISMYVICRLYIE